jgi:hypothetical protein
MAVQAVVVQVEMLEEMAILHRQVQAKEIMVELEVQVLQTTAQVVAVEHQPLVLMEHLLLVVMVALELLTQFQAVL